MGGFQNSVGTVVRGPIYSRDYDTDGYRFVPAIELNGNDGLVGTWTLTRNAGGDYSMNLTAAANSPIFAININELLAKIGTDPLFSSTSEINPAVMTHFPTPTTVGGTASTTKVRDDFEGHIIRGYQLTAVTIAYSLATAALTTHTLTLFQTTYANGAATSIATKQAATAIGTATTTNIAVTSIPVTTPYVLSANTANVGDYLELNLTNPGTAVYKLYGIGLSFNYCLL